MRMINLVNKMIRKLFGGKCSHNSVNQYEKGSYCPDCGNKIKLSWIILRCQQCKALRMSKVNPNGDITPLKEYCSDCGNQSWFSRKKDTLDVFESFYAIAVKEIINEKTAKSNSTYVWVDNPDNSVTMQRGKIIKANRRG